VETPGIFHLWHVLKAEALQDASVVDHLELSSGSHKWNISFIRVAYDWEVDIFASFFNLLYSFSVSRGVEDKLCWVPFKRWLFDVRLFYSVLVPLDGTPFPWKRIWWNKAPARAAFFAWLAALWKIHTTDNLRKWHIIVVDWCAMCKV
jgi:hypothetical protein